MTDEPLRIPIAHSVRYVARGLPDVPNQYGRGVLRPSEITLNYRAAPDSQLGRVHAYVAGRLWVDGAEIPLLNDGLYGQHYDDGLDGWPEWLAEEARLHDPDAAPADPPASTAPLAAGLPLVKGNCPACGTAGLFLGSGGYVTCSLADCPEPDAATTVLEQYANEAHAPEHTWAAELHDPLADEWVPGTRYAVRDRAVKALAHGRSVGPTWKDGTPTERRLVRATTTYTVEADQPAAVSQPGKEG